MYILLLSLSPLFPTTSQRQSRSLAKYYIHQAKKCDLSVASGNYRLRVLTEGIYPDNTCTSKGQHVLLVVPLA